MPNQTPFSRLSICTVAAFLASMAFASRALAAAPSAAAAPGAAGAPLAAGNVDAARLSAADKEPQNWFTGGRDKDGSYYSPLSAIDANNVKRLGFA